MLIEPVFVFGVVVLLFYACSVGINYVSCYFGVLFDAFVSTVRYFWFL